MKRHTAAQVAADAEHESQAFEERPRTAPCPGTVDLGAVTARDVEDEAEFVCDASVGTPAVKFAPSFDTAGAVAGAV